MYGLVNQAIGELVTTLHDEETWWRIQERSGVMASFLSSEAYDDELTFRLLAAAAEELATPADDLLRAFGRHWALVTAPAAYGALLDANGTTLRQFLANLPQLHARVMLLLPRLRPPSFEVVECGPDALELTYRSPRQGLEPFLEGILEGLAERFATPLRLVRLDGGDGAAGLDGAGLDGAGPDGAGFARYLLDSSEAAERPSGAGAGSAA